MLKYALICSILVISPVVFADTCPCPSDPSNFSLIQIGDSLSHIKQLCCAPLSEKTTPKADTRINEEWTYFPAIGSGASGGSVKLVVSFVNDKIVNITSNMQPLPNTSLCSTAPTGPGATGRTIQIGDSSKTVKSICGEAAFIAKSNNTTSDTPKMIDVTELDYKGPPPVTLTFENGVLKTIEQPAAVSASTPSTVSPIASQP